MKIEALIKAFESGKKENLPEEFGFLLDPEFKAEIEALGSKKEKIKAAAQVLADETGTIDKETVGKLAGAMKQAGLLEGEGDNEETSEDAPKEGEEGSEEASQEDGEIPDEASEEGEEVPSEEAGQGDHSDSEAPPVEGEEEQAVDEEGNPIEEGSSEELEPAAVDEDGNPIEGDSAESDSPVADHLQRFKEEATGTPGDVSGVAGEGGKLQRVVQRALAAIGALLVSD